MLTSVGIETILQEENLLCRFSGGCQWLGWVEVSAITRWISSIDLRDWPQQNPKGMPLRPAMATDHRWYGFGKVIAEALDSLMLFFPGCARYQEMLSVVMPGDKIPPHTDSQPPAWLCRVHVPLMTNARSQFIVNRVRHSLFVGNAYRVNTEAEHSVENNGRSPRIHLMFDVRSC